MKEHGLALSYTVEGITEKAGKIDTHCFIKSSTWNLTILPITVIRTMQYVHFIYERQQIAKKPI